MDTMDPTEEIMMSLMAVGYRKFISTPFRYHIAFGFVIRLIFIIYGEIHDRLYEVAYTDVDYKIFTDAARLVLQGESPYKRHTYRYSPILAYLMIPNVIIHKSVGKLIFAIFDLLIAYVSKRIVKRTYDVISHDVFSEKVARYSCFFWVYNPVSIAVSTRGNADSFSCIFILISLMYLLVYKGYFNVMLSGLFLGLSIHLRLYPIVYSFPMYLSLGEYDINRNTSVYAGLKSLIPNVNQIILATSCVFSLTFLTYGLYSLYGYEGIYETYIYHLVRKDTKHNYSILFYHLYLNADTEGLDIVKVFVLIFECTLLFVLSVLYGSRKKYLAFCLFCQTVVMTTFNGVVTAQYFIWYYTLMPLIVQDMEVSARFSAFLAVLWSCAQTLWLVVAYLLEFKCLEVFLLIWSASVLFFFVNIYILSTFIRAYYPGHAFSLGKLKPF